MKLSLVVAQDLKGQIGLDNKLLWDLRGDMEFFKAVTKSKVVIMGRKTFESIGKPLKDRTNIVITSKAGKEFPDGVTAIPTLEAALDTFRLFQDEVVVMGGEQLYKEVGKHPELETIYMTMVYHIFDKADTLFPYIHGEFKCVQHTNMIDKYPYTTMILERT